MVEFEDILARHYELEVCLNEEAIEEILREQNPDGRFRGISTEEKDTENDCRFLHCSMVRWLASGAYFYGQEKYIQAVLKGVDAWRDMKFEKAADWFHNSIFIPRMLLDTLLLMRDKLGKEREAYLIHEIQKAYTEERYKFDIGANIIWASSIRLHLACYLHDKEMFVEAIKRINEEMRFSDQHTEEDKQWRKNHWRKYIDNEIKEDIYEGVQRDFSFFEHGPLLHTGAYGKAYFSTLCQICYELKETKYLDEESIHLLVDFLLEHYQWTILGEIQDYNVIGRQIAAKPTADQNLTKLESRLSFEELIEILLNSNLRYRTKEIKDLKKRIEERKRTVTGTKYFPIGKYLVHQEESMAITVRMTDCNLLASESVNWENLKCWYLGDGVQYIYTDGKDYDGVFPVYEWDKIPGTTVETKPMKVLDQKQHIAVDGSSSSACGGISDGIIGAAAMELVRDDLTARKAWFCFEGEVVSLGSNITCGGCFPVLTTVNQMLKRGTVSVNRNRRSETEDYVYDWVGHHKIAYLFGEDEQVRINVGEQTGDWNDITYDRSGVRPEEDMPCSSEMVTIWIEHGIKPDNNCYEYKIVPWQEGEIPKSQTEVLANTGKVQAAAQGDFMLAVFWEPGELEFRGQKIIVDEPCVICASNGDVKKSKLQKKQ
jgi:chondroitin AC lyase